MAEVGLFAMKHNQITRAILPLTMAGIEVDIVQMSPIALYNYICFDQLKGSGSKDSVVVLDIGTDATDLVITNGFRSGSGACPSAATTSPRPSPRS